LCADFLGDLLWGIFICAGFCWEFYTEFGGLGLGDFCLCEFLLGGKEKEKTKKQKNHKKTKKTKKKEASNGIHLYAVLATNLLLLLAVVRRAERSPPRRPPMGYHHP